VNHSASTQIADEIPPSDVIRKRLAQVVTEAGLLRSLLRLASRREREAARLAKLCEEGGRRDAS
jgi:hypothetical protein